MTHEKDYSDSILNAFIDGELDDREKNHLIADMKIDRALKERVLRLREIRELVQYAYKGISAPERPHQFERRSGVRAINLYVASVVLVIGVLVGWGTQGYFNSGNSLLKFAEITEQNNIITNRENVTRLMIHVTTDDPARLNIMLDETEKLLKQYELNQKDLEMSILTNARGINLVLASTPFANRLHELSDRYHNITLKACSQTLKRLSKDELGNIELLHEAEVVPSALGEVIKRRQQGWSYIKI